MEKAICVTCVRARKCAKGVTALPPAPPYKPLRRCSIVFTRV